VTVGGYQRVNGWSRGRHRTLTRSAAPE